MKELTNIRYWIFDLDNTLYSGQTQVFSEVDKKMSAFISEKMNVDLHYLSDYSVLISTAISSGLIKPELLDTLNNWREHPDQWAN